MEPWYATFYDRLQSLHETFHETLDGLPTEALDWSPYPEMNSLAVLAAHTAGSQRFWIGDVAGQEPSGRDRPAEFVTRDRSAGELQALLAGSLAHAQSVLGRLTLADLQENRVTPDGLSITVTWALLHALEHTALHLGHAQISRQLWLLQQQRAAARSINGAIKLTAEDFAGARSYLIKSGRPLDRALFRYYFEDGPVTAVWEALAAYQNPDGGFGHALEPDVRTPSSSALATGIALRLLADTDAPAAYPLVQGALAFLDATLDRNTLTWRVVPRDTNDFPHAPWWHNEDGSLSRTFDDYQIIPRAELVAYLCRFAAPGQFAWLGDVTNAAVRAVEKLPLGGGGGDDLVYAIRLAEAEGLAEIYQRAVLQRIMEVTPAAVSRDPAQWLNYSIPPLKLAPSPQSPVAGILGEELLAQNLDFLIAQQADDGAWNPTWSWGDFYADAWPVAREEWRAELTLHNLLTLRDYGRIAQA